MSQEETNQGSLFGCVISYTVTTTYHTNLCSQYLLRAMQNQVTL